MTETVKKTKEDVEAREKAIKALIWTRRSLMDAVYNVKDQRNREQLLRQILRATINDILPVFPEANTPQAMRPSKPANPGNPLDLQDYFNKRGDR